MARKYDFYNRWIIEASPAKVWEEVSDPASWQHWWPGLVQVEVEKHEPGIIGSSAELIWRSSTGYRLKHIITVTQVEPGKTIGFTSLGDLEGYGSWEFGETDGKTHMAIEWHVQPTKIWMRLFDPILRLIFVSNHKALMRNGEAGLNKFLESN